MVDEDGAFVLWSGIGIQDEASFVVEGEFWGSPQESLASAGLT
jgi:hypothetical protein